MNFLQRPHSVRFGAPPKKWELNRARTTAKTDFMLLQENIREATAYRKEIEHFPLLTQSEELALGEQLYPLVQIYQAKRRVEEDLANARRVGSQLDLAEHLTKEEYIAELVLQRRALQAQHAAERPKHEATIQKFVQGNLLLVLAEATLFANQRNCRVMEAVGDGNAGLLIASERFDYTTGNKFSTMATNWICQSMQRGFNQGASTHMEKRRKDYVVCQAELVQKLGHKPTLQEIQDRMGVGDKLFQMVVRALQGAQTWQLESSSDEEDGPNDLPSIKKGPAELADPKKATPPEVKEQISWLRQQLQGMELKKRLILSHLHGLPLTHDFSLKELLEKTSQNLKEEFKHFALSLRKEQPAQWEQWQALLDRTFEDEQLIPDIKTLDKSWGKRIKRMVTIKYDVKKNLRQTGALLFLTRERVRQLSEQALALLGKIKPEKAGQQARPEKQPRPPLALRKEELDGLSLRGQLLLAHLSGLRVEPTYSLGQLFKAFPSLSQELPQVQSNAATALLNHTFEDGKLADALKQLNPAWGERIQRLVEKPEGVVTSPAEIRMLLDLSVERIRQMKSEALAALPKKPKTRAPRKEKELVQ